MKKYATINFIFYYKVLICINLIATVPALIIYDPQYTSINSIITFTVLLWVVVATTLISVTAMLLELVSKAHLGRYYKLVNPVKAYDATKRNNGFN